MNVGIINFHRSRNNGAVLQAYALQKIVQRLGHTVKNIDYYPLAIMQSTRILKPGITLRTLARNVYALSRYKTLKRLSDRFESFVQRNITLTDFQYVTGADLENPPRFDAYVCGSDQVWNPMREIQMGKPYFLSFVPPGYRRIAYAASFAVSEIPDSRREDIARSISVIDFLSVRETQAQIIVKELTGRESVLALDSTLLIPKEEWDTIANPFSVEEPFILIYGAMTEQLSHLVTKVKQETGMKTVAIFPALSPIPIPDVDYVLRDVGPTEFLGLFQKAAVVVINTFHGVAFSIIYRKPFLATPAANPSRIISLLDILGLSGRWIPDVEQITSIEIRKLINTSLEGITSSLEQHQINSVTFLETALQI